MLFAAHGPVLIQLFFQLVLACDPIRVASPSNGELFSNLAISGNLLVIGAPSSNDQIGEVRVYKRVGGQWLYETTIIPSDGQTDDDFGFAVVLDADILAVGAPHVSTFQGSSHYGSVYIYRRFEFGEEVQWIEEIKIPAPDDPPSHGFGYDVALSDGILVIGQPGEVEKGAVHIYRQAGSQWIPDGVLLGPGTGNQFGFSVDVDENCIVVGVPAGLSHAGTSGYTSVFRKTNGVWSIEDAFTGSGLGNYDGFGTSVAIDGDRIVVGAPRADGVMAQAGRSFVFRHEEDDWIEEIALENPDGQMQDRFGSSVQIRESIVAIGAELENRDDADQGAVYLYEIECDEWKLIKRVVSEDETTHGISLGNNLSLDHMTLAISSGGPVYVSSLSFASTLGRFALFQNCFGKNHANEPSCYRFDATANGSIDLLDLTCSE